MRCEDELHTSVISAYAAACARTFERRFAVSCALRYLLRASLPHARFAVACARTFAYLQERLSIARKKWRLRTLFPRVRASFSDSALALLLSPQLPRKVVALILIILCSPKYVKRKKRREH